MVLLKTELFYVVATTYLFLLSLVRIFDSFNREPLKTFSFWELPRSIYTTEQRGFCNITVLKKYTTFEVTSEWIKLKYSERCVLFSSKMFRRDRSRDVLSLRCGMFRVRRLFF